MVSQKKIELYINADGVNNSPLEISSFRYDIKRMGGAPTISCTLMYESCLDNVWNDNVYALFNGEKFYLKQTPTSSRNNDDARYKHELELIAERYILENTYFYDAVSGNPTENDKPVTNDTKFTFYGNIEEFVRRMNASLEYTKLQKVEKNDDGEEVISGYHVILDEDIVNRDEKMVSFDGAVFSQAIQEAYNTFAIPYYFNGKEIHVGFTDNEISETIEYGVDEALLSVTKNNANFKVINRATGVGSTENLPYYYPNNGPKGEVELNANGSITVEDIKIVDQEAFNNLSVNDTFTFHGDVSNNHVNIEAVVPSTKTNVAFTEDKATISKLYIEDKKSVGVQIKYNFFFDTDSDSEIELKWQLENYPNVAINMTPPLKTAWGKDHIEFQVKKIVFNGNDTSQDLGFDIISEKHTYYSNIVSRSGQTDTGTIANKMRQSGVKFVCPNTHGNVTIIIEAELKTLGNFWEVVPDYFWGENSKKKPYSDVVFTTNISTYATGGWKDQDGKSYNMKNYGVEFLKEPEYGDSFSYSIINYVRSTDNLQPSIYRATDGKERFYNAKNYPFIKQSGYELQYGEYVVNGYVHNDSYKDDNGKYYVFANEYNGTNPREHVFSVDDIKPTIKEVEVNGLRIDMFTEFAYDEGDNDETYTDDSGEVNFKHPYFFAKLRKLGFNLFEHASESGPMTISFTSGHCGACNFEVGVSEEYANMNPVQIYEEDTVDENGVFHAKGSLQRDEEGRVLCGLEDFQGPVQPYEEQQDTVNYEVWIALRKEESTYGILMPKAPKYDDEGNVIESGHRPKACSSDTSNDGDTFVITNINLPDEYIYRAEEKLEKAIVKYIWENNKEKFNFSVTFSRIFLEENPSFREQLNENARVILRYNNDDYLLYVSSYSYQMNEGEVLPNITIELDDTLTISQNPLQNAINEVKSDIANAISAIDVSAIGTKYFLRKDVDDYAQGIIDFRRGVYFGDSSDVKINKDGSAKLTIDYLEVTRKATFTSLEIQEKTHVGGQILLSPAAMTCSNVVEVRDTTGTLIAWRCYFQTKGEGGEEIFNTFTIDDQAICQTYNAWGSKFYWRLVTEVGEDYIDLSVEDCAEESDAPSIGDKIIQLGNRTNTSRQAAQVLSAHGSDAPSFIMYNGINSYSLEGKNVTGIMWNPIKEEPQMYSYGDFFFGDRNLENDFITFQKKEGDDRKKLHINADVTIGANSSGLENLSEWQSKQEEIDNAQNDATEAKREASSAKKSAANAQETADSALTSAQEADRKAQDAQSVADAASQRLNEWASDGIISPVEKQALKNELAVVNSDYDDIHKQYQKYIQEFDKLILADGKYYVTEDGYIFNVEVANSNWSSFRSAYQSYVAELTLKTSTSESVEVGDLTNKQKAYYSARTAILEDISLSIKAEADYSKKQANQAIQDASNAKGIADTANASVITLGTRIDGVDKTIAEINNKLDGVVESYFDDYIPSRDNLPASEWIASGTEADHIGDTFTNTALNGEGAGQSWRWLEQADGSYDWQQIADSDAAKALALAGQAKAAADGKTKTFLVTPTNYNVGDIWIVGDTVPEGFAFKKGDILATSSDSVSYVANHWSKVINYNDEFQNTLDAKVGELNTAINNVEQNANDYTEEVRDALQGSINALNEAKANIKDVYTTAQADGLISASEQNAINAANKYAQEAVTASETVIKAWADGEIKQAEQDAIDASNASLQQAKNELDEALRDLESEVDGVRTLANNAQAIASSATSKLNEWASDNTISPIEKQGLRDELAFVEADYQDIYKNYQKYIQEFTEFILSDDRTYVTSDGFVFNIEVAYDNWELFTNAYNSYRNDLSAKINASGNVAIGNLRKYQSSFYSARTAILNDISLAIKAETDYGVTNSDKAMAKVKESADELVAQLNVTESQLRDAISDAEQNANGYTDEVKQMLDKALEDLDNAKASVEQVNEIVSEDGLISEAEKRAMAKAEEYAEEARKAAETAAEAYADGEIKASEEKLIADAQKRVDDAKAELEKALEEVTTSVEYVEGLANNAQSTALSATSKLNQWSADNVISPLEKQGLRDEIAFIKADYNDISLQYEKYIQEFDKLILSDGKQYVTVDEFVFNVEVANTNWQAYKSAYNAYKSDLESKTANNDTVAIGTLKTTQSAYYNKRALVLEDITLAIKAEADYATEQSRIAKKEAEEAKAEIADYEYLKNALGNAKSLAVEGVVMSQMVAVADKDKDNAESVTEADVVAFLNGSGEFLDNTHGKMILAGGIPSVEESGLFGIQERAKEASTRIYEDGCTFTKNMHLEDGCFIGDDLVIRTSKKQVEGGNTEEKDDDVYINSASIEAKEWENSHLGASFSSEGMFVRGKSIHSGRWQTAELTNGCSGRCMQIRIDKASSVIPGQDCILTDKPVGLDIYAPDSYGIYARAGLFAGLRPKIRTITEDDSVDELDHTILIDSKSSISITLPVNAQEGQVYEFLMTNQEGTTVKHPILSNAEDIHDLLGNKWNLPKLEIVGYGIGRFIRAKDASGTLKWWFYRIR